LLQKEVEKVLEKVREELKYAKMSPWQKAVASLGMRFQVRCLWMPNCCVVASPKHHDEDVYAYALILTPAGSVQF